MEIDGSANSHGNPELCALAAERKRRLSAAIEKLPEQKRECFLLRSSGLPYRDIAEVLGVTASNVATLVHRAVARLREDLS
jgi:RNA polymerase sigma factor (sigma-70 family)